MYENLKNTDEEIYLAIKKEEEKAITYNNYINAKIEAQIETTIKQYDLTQEEKELIRFILRRKNINIKTSVLISYLKFLMPFYNNEYYSIERKLEELTNK